MSTALAILGRSGVLAIGAWCFALMSYFSYLAPLARELERQRETVAQSALLSSANASGTSTQNMPLPGEARRARDLARLVSAADRLGVRLTRQSFEEQINAESGVSGVTRLTGRLTATTQYPALRNWLAEIAATAPSIAVRTLRLDRPDDPLAPLQLALEFEYRSSGKTGPTDQDEGSTVAPAPTSHGGPIHDPFAQAVVRDDARRISPPAPDPVALPFGYSGTYVSAGTPFYLLTLGDETFRISPGETIGSTAFRLDGADSGRLHFTHLPTSSRLSLPIGSIPP